MKKMVVLVVLVGLLAACGKPTQTPYPTYTPYATYTQYPTPTRVAMATPTPTLAPTTYVVQPGDSLAQIAAKFGTTAEIVCAFNALPDCNLITPGQELLMPPEGVTPTKPRPSPTTTHTPTATDTPTPTLTPTPTWTPTSTSTPTATATQAKCGVPEAIAWNDAGRHEGETIVVYGPVVDSHFASTSSGQPTFLNLGKPYPDPGRFTVLIWGDDRQAFIDAFGGPPEDIFLHRDVCVRGLIEYYEGSYEIILRVPGDIWFQ